MEYDGIVLESWTTWAAYSILDKPNLRQKALEFVHALGTTLHSMKASNAGSEERSMQLHLVIPPPTDHKKDARSLTRADMTVIENSINGLCHDIRFLRTQSSRSKCSGALD
jgi:chitinase domain-containing protein 1